MPDDRTTVPAPTYPIMLQVLMRRVYASPRPVPDFMLPGGPIPDRLARIERSATTLVACDGVEASDAEVASVDPAEYWARTVPHRLLVHGPLIDIAKSSLVVEERRAVERRVLDTYYHHYLATPLPADLLEMIERQHSENPRDHLPEWLENARELLMAADSPAEARRRRLHLRAAALRRYAMGECSERGTAIAELFVDVLTLCHGAKLDVEHATAIAVRHDGSVAVALRHLEDNNDTETGRLLSHLLHADLTIDDFPQRDRTRVLIAARHRKSGDRLLYPVTVSTKAAEAGASTSGALRAAPVQAQPTSGPRALYRALREQLATTILSRPDLCRRLALIGVEHLMGVRHQRVLLCGGTASGKSHAARALAEALSRPHLVIGMQDITATGWKGVDAPDVLDILAARAGRDLNGAVLVLDEIDKIRIIPGSDGNSLQAQLQLQSSLLGLIDGASVASEGRTGLQLDTSGLLVLGTGAFGGRFNSTPPTTDDLTRWGWIDEFAARWGERICLRPPTRQEACEILERSERSVANRLGPLATALDVELIVPVEVLRYTVDLWFRSGADFRSAAEWLLGAARSRLLAVLEGDSRETIVLVHDDIEQLSQLHRRND